MLEESKEPRYDFMLILDNIEDFSRAERLLYDSLSRVSIFTKWCEPMTNGDEYACEVPSPDRLMKIQSANFILPYLEPIQKEPEKLEQYKSEMVEKTDQEEWKWLISKLKIVNRNEFKII
jgi:hypothetical protein